ncbi:MAG TPA: hypothetical protein VGW33_14575 [Terriglobia bacterium]|nr:hypothetical protein [Terriglobia bacterium]
MSLRRSPTRTPALLAANRLNARKSTGPRTPEGKRRAAFNALRHGRRAETLQRFLAQAASAPPPREAAELLGLYRALHAALLPDPQNERQMRYVRRCTVLAWTAKRRLARLAASRRWRAFQFAASAGVFPVPLRMRIKRAAWRVTVSLWMRRGRGHAHCRVRPACGWQEGRARLHAGVTVTSSMRHPVEGYSCLEELPPGIAPRVVFRTKPESYRKQEGSVNVITISKARGRNHNPAVDSGLDWAIARGMEKAKHLVRGLGAALLRRMRETAP